jgi:hypothetical protein
MSGSSFTNIFGGTTVSPSNPSYLALALSANTQLYWPLETTESVPIVASQIDVTPTTTGLAVLMPPADTGSTGIATIITNVGASTFTVKDSTGVAIATVDTTESWIITLTDNTTAAGVWRGYQLASTASSAVAADLAGAGLQADGTRLRTYMPQVSLNVNTNIGASYRAKSIVWTGGVGTLQLADIAVLGDGWYCGVVNNGTDALVITTTSSQQINNDTSLIMNPGNSGIIVAGPVRFNTLGVLIGPLAVENGGTGADTANQALTNLGGTTIGKTIFTAPSAAAVRAAIGVSAAFTELTLGTSTVLTAGNAGDVIICTSGIVLTLPLTSSVNTNFVIQVKASNGNVTVTPNGADSINGGSVGVGVTVPNLSSALFTTDASGKWWTLYGPAVSATTITTTGSAAVGGSLDVTGTAAVGGTLTVTGNASAANFNTAGTVAATGTVTGGNINTGGTVNATGAITGGAFNTSGTLNVGGAAAVGAINVTTTANISGLASVGSLNTTGTVAASGVITAANGTATNQVVNCAQFNPSAATNGYIKLPGGVTFQWGKVEQSSLTVAVSFPVAFSGTAYSVTMGGGDEGYSWAPKSITSSGFNSVAGTFSPGLYAYWHAVGPT